MAGAAAALLLMAPQPVMAAESTLADLMRPDFEFVDTNKDGLVSPVRPWGMKKGHACGTCGHAGVRGACQTCRDVLGTRQGSSHHAQLRMHFGQSQYHYGAHRLFL